MIRGSHIDKYVHHHDGHKDCRLGNNAQQVISIINKTGTMQFQTRVYFFNSRFNRKHGHVGYCCPTYPAHAFLVLVVADVWSYCGSQAHQQPTCASAFATEYPPNLQLPAVATPHLDQSCCTRLVTGIPALATDKHYFHRYLFVQNGRQAPESDHLVIGVQCNFAGKTRIGRDRE